MTGTYHDIVEEALAADEIREHNVVALGDGENTADDHTTARIAFNQAWNREQHAVAHRDSSLPSALSRTATNERSRRSRPTLRAFDHDSRPGCEWVSCEECGMTLDECAGFKKYVATVEPPQVREWQQAQPGCMGTLCNECRMSDEDCAEYQDFLDSEGYGVQQFTTAQGLKKAGAFTPRCDH